MKKNIVILFGLLFTIGCSNTQPEVTQQAPKPIQPSAHEVNATKPPKPRYVPPPKSSFKPKEVQTDNYASAYMYPEDTVVQPTIQTQAPKEDRPLETSITKEECITMIGQEKFDKYTAMFSGEAATLKRCMMLKAIQKK